MKHGNYSVTRGSLNLRDVLRGGNFALMIVMHGGRRTGGRADGRPRRRRSPELFRNVMRARFTDGEQRENPSHLARS